MRPAFLLKGYAGTGKTTIVCTLVDVARQFGFKYVLLAPYGPGRQGNEQLFQKGLLPFTRKFTGKKPTPIPAASCLSGRRTSIPKPCLS